jgi:Cu(I)/Ag(I) efflux system membrane protein CusA/SilA
MLIEPFTTFVVPTIYCAYMEFKLRAGLRDELLEMSVDEASANKPHPDAVAA